MPNVDKSLKEAIKVAALELGCGDASLRDRLASAIRSLDRFLGHRESWPPVLQVRVQDISDELKSGESAEAVIAQMDHSNVRQLAERILRLYADCHS
jgi:hypothetical protein